MRNAIDHFIPTVSHRFLKSMCFLSIVREYVLTQQCSLYSVSSDNTYIQQACLKNSGSQERRP